MTTKLRSWWQQIKRYPFTIIVVFIWFFALFAFILTATIFGSDWTGIAGGVSKITTTHTPQGITTTTEYVPAKTLWDWLQFTTALGGVVFTVYGSAITVAAQIRMPSRLLCNGNGATNHFAGLK